MSGWPTRKHGKGRRRESGEKEEGKKEGRARKTKRRGTVRMMNYFLVEVSPCSWGAVFTNSGCYETWLALLFAWIPAFFRTSPCPHPVFFPYFHRKLGQPEVFIEVIFHIDGNQVHTNCSDSHTWAFIGNKSIMQSRFVTYFLCFC